MKPAQRLAQLLSRFPGTREQHIRWCELGLEQWRAWAEAEWVKEHPDATEVPELFVWSKQKSAAIATWRKRCRTLRQERPRDEGPRDGEGTIAGQLRLIVCGEERK